jgi:hypothetical protein
MIKKTYFIFCVLSLLLSNNSFSQQDATNPCPKKTLDFAQIMSGSYDCEIEVHRYAKDQEIKKVTVRVEKIGENKVRISATGVPSYELDISKASDYSIGGSKDELRNGATQNLRVSLSVYDKPAKITGGTGNGTYEKGDVFWWFEGLTTDNNKTQDLLEYEDNSHRIELGDFKSKIGDYEVYDKGEVFYRALSKEHYCELRKTKKVSPTDECCTSPTESYAEKFTGCMVKFIVKHGTIDA